VATLARLALGAGKASDAEKRLAVERALRKAEEFANPVTLHVLVWEDLEAGLALRLRTADAEVVPSDLVVAGDTGLVAARLAGPDTAGGVRPVAAWGDRPVAREVKYTIVSVAWDGKGFRLDEAPGVLAPAEPAPGRRDRVEDGAAAERYRRLAAQVAGLAAAYGERGYMIGAEPDADWSRAEPADTPAPQPTPQAIVRGSLGRGTGSGAIDRADVAAVFRRRKGELEACYEAALKRNPNAGGEVKLRFSLGTGGTVTSIDVMDNSTGDTEVGACMAGEVRSWPFPAADDGEVSFVFTIVLASE